MTKLLAGHEQVSLKLMHTVKEQTVTLTFNLALRFLFATHRLIMVIIRIIFFKSRHACMHDKVMGRTRTSSTEVYAQSLNADCDLDI